LFEENCKDFDFTHEEKEKVISLILATKISNYCNIQEGSLEERFVLCDLNSLLENDKKKLIEIEKRLQREYQFVDWDDYKKGKRDIFGSITARFPQSKRNTDFILDYIGSCPPKIGIYAGSFNPFHIGHFNIKDFLPYHQVDYWDGFLTDYILGKSYYRNTTLIRGLRTDTDFKKEEIQLRFWQDVYPQLKTVFIPCDKRYEHVSSSALKVLDKFGKSNSFYTISKDSIYSELKKNWEYNNRQ